MVGSVLGFAHAAHRPRAPRATAWQRLPISTEAGDQISEVKLKIAEIIKIVSTGVQIIFFLATGSVAILSYNTAKRTLFQPLRTEIFKKQIENMGSVLKMFTGKGEVELRNDFGFDTLIKANTYKMYDAYAWFAFDLERPEERREYRIELCPASVVRPEGLRAATDYLATDVPEARPKPEKWEYKGYDISLPRAFVDKEGEFQLILDNPLLPRDIATMLEEYLGVVRSNVRIIQDVIVKASEEMPVKYPEVNDLKNARFEWIRNRINPEFQQLDPLAKRINAYVRTYFDSDNLLPRQRQSNRMADPREQKPVPRHF